MLDVGGNHPQDSYRYQSITLSPNSKGSFRAHRWPFRPLVNSGDAPVMHPKPISPTAQNALNCSALLVAQGEDGIDSAGAVGRNQTGDGGNGGEQQDAGRGDAGVATFNTVKLGGNESTQRES